MTVSKVPHKIVVSYSKSLQYLISVPLVPHDRWGGGDFISPLNDCLFNELHAGLLLAGSNEAEPFNNPADIDSNGPER